MIGPSPCGCCRRRRGRSSSLVSSEVLLIVVAVVLMAGSILEPCHSFSPQPCHYYPSFTSTRTTRSTEVFLLQKSSSSSCSRTTLVRRMTTTKNPDWSGYRQQPQRTLIKLEKFTRFPIWPAWNGVLIWLIGKLLGDTVASELEQVLGGRVCPNFFMEEQQQLTTTTTSPFLLLVHHSHSFASWDILRWFQRSFILPEGFPAHPHRGFITLTYFIQGGFRHRDSIGVEQYYGVHNKNNNNNNNNKASFPHSQWLNTGAGLLHEEMFDLERATSFFIPQRHELYQLWINLPASRKLHPPTVQLLADDVDTPVVYEQDRNVQVRVLAGSYHSQHPSSEEDNYYTSTASIVTDLMVLHVTLQPNTIWNCPLPNPDVETCFLYVRKGSLTCSQINAAADDDTSTTAAMIPPHATAYFSSTGSSLELLSTGGGVADFMFLAGVPLRGEPCIAQGSMVMNSQREISQAYSDYQAGYMGKPWDHKLTRDQWQQHVQQFPSRYKYIQQSQQRSEEETSPQKKNRTS